MEAVRIVMNCCLVIVLFISITHAQGENPLFPEGFFNSEFRNSFRKSERPSTSTNQNEPSVNFAKPDFGSFENIFGNNAEDSGLNGNVGTSNPSGNHNPNVLDSQNLNNELGLRSASEIANNELSKPRVTTSAPQVRRRGGGRGRQRPPLSPETLALVRRKANGFVGQDVEWLPNLLQLVFHSCVGGCDGCLNFEEKDNKALEGTYNSIKSLWAATDARTHLSLADFIVLLATVATEIAINKSDDLMQPITIDFKTGRRTCRDPNNYHLDHEFPESDTTDGVGFLMKEFDLDRDHAIALLGAHSLGACKAENSGFRGRWDNTPLTLDNHYYKSLTETPNWVAVPAANGSVQWNSTEENGPMMLHADMALLVDFDVDQHGRPSCTDSSNCMRSKEAGPVQLYAASLEIWVERFIRAFLKMVDKKPVPQPRRVRPRTKRPNPNIVT